jgi:hypothetical protein
MNMNEEPNIVATAGIVVAISIIIAGAWIAASNLNTIINYIF